MEGKILRKRIKLSEITFKITDIYVKDVKLNNVATSKVAFSIKCST